MNNRPSFPISALDYDLPPELIAQTPPPRREDARLLIVDRATGRIEDRRVPDLVERFNPGDLLVLNDTKVLPAKFTFRRATGGRIDGLFLEEFSPGEWLVMLDGVRRILPDEPLTTVGRSGRTVTLRLRERLDEGKCRVRVEPVQSAEAILDDIGVTPLPPYIHRNHQSVERERHDEEEARRHEGTEARRLEGEFDEPIDRLDRGDRERYQTVYAKVPGAVAAPTAGFHLTPELLSTLQERGVEIAYVTLHVGLGTFKPVTVADLADHPMHAERYDFPAETAEAIHRCKSRGGRVIAVGTTSVRVLETVAARELSDSSTLDPSNQVIPSVASSLRRSVALAPRCGSTDLLLYPPCEFRVVDALLTNFHLPRSTLLALVMAFAGIDLTRRAYVHAITERYRFYSFGDAMFIL